MISVSLYGGHGRLEMEMDDTVSNLMWIRVFCGKHIQFTACRYDWRDWYIEYHELCSPSFVVIGCGTFALGDETDGSAVKQFLEDCKSAKEK